MPTAEGRFSLATPISKAATIALGIPLTEAAAAASRISYPPAERACCTASRSTKLRHCSGGLWSCEKIAFTTCQMSNVCCALFNVVVKTPDDPLTRRPHPWCRAIWSSGRFVSGSFYNFIEHRTTDIRHLTSLGSRHFIHSSETRDYILDATSSA